MKLPESISGPRLLRTRDLEAAGMTREDVLEALDLGLLVRPNLVSANPEHGIYATAVSRSEYMHELPDAMFGFVYDGQAVYHMQYAAMRHGLSTSLPPTVQILLPATTRVKERPGISITRTRREAALTEGVEEVPTAFGVPFRMTSKARTVVDLLRAKNRSDDDWRHGLDAMASYLDDNGDASELIRLSRLFEGWVPDVVETAIHSYSPGMAP